MQLAIDSTKGKILGGQSKIDTNLIFVINLDIKKPVDIQSWKDVSLKLNSFVIVTINTCLKSNK